MSEEEYKALYNRIKQDLYDEFINPETATYGADVLRQKEAKQNIFSHRITDSDIIREEIEQLKVVMNKYEDDEEYEHAAIIKKRIEYLKRKLWA